MDTNTNEVTIPSLRAERIRRIIVDHYDPREAGLQEALADVLTDLMHLATLYKLDWELADEVSVSRSSVEYATRGLESEVR